MFWRCSGRPGGVLEVFWEHFRCSGCRAPEMGWTKNKGIYDVSIVDTGTMKCGQGIKNDKKTLCARYFQDNPKLT